MRKLKYVSALSVISFVLLLSACGEATTGDKPASGKGEGESVESSEGEALYKKMCISCHGNELQGRAGPNLQKVGARLTEDEIIEIVSNGRKGMPKFGKSISAEEIQSLATWLAEHN
ncbi:c-type cytochrome [Paenibacillus sp. FJAT-27812]|uniref:c-type cytochrome n=1 Tax=Paenibacillus sp. FJAT-27812 TaxID=1684143 RepID=UPI0006A76CD2|nr:cytochrome c [Paenibacillus sp. FJAT-27812]